MANRKISDFPVTTTISDTDFLTLLHAGVNQIMTWANAKATIFTALFTNASDFPIDADATSAGNRSVTFTLSATTFVRLLWNNSLAIFQFVNNAGTLQKLAVANATGSTHAVTKAQLDTEVSARVAADSALVAAQVFTDSFETTPFVISEGHKEIQAHGIGAIPTSTESFLKCVTAEYGYLVDQEVPVSNNIGISAYTNPPLSSHLTPWGHSIALDSTNVTIIQVLNGGGYPAGYWLADLTPGSEGGLVNITNAKWDLIVRLRA